MKFNNIYQWKFTKIEEWEIDIAIALIDYYIKQYNQEKGRNSFIVISYNDITVNNNLELIINIWISNEVSEQEQKDVFLSIDYDIHRMINQL